MFSATTSCGVMWVTPDSGSTCAGGRPRAARRDSRSVWATTTLSSARPWMSISGRRQPGGACASSELASYASGVLVGVAEVALGVGGVVAAASR